MGPQSQQTIEKRQKDERRRGGGAGLSWGEAQTDNIVILRLPEGQTRQRNKDKWNEMQNKGNVNIYSSATGKTAPGGDDTKWLQHAGTIAVAEKRGTGGREEKRRVKDWFRKGGPV